MMVDTMIYTDRQLVEPGKRKLARLLVLACNYSGDANSILPDEASHWQSLEDSVFSIYDSFKQLRDTVCPHDYSLFVELLLH